jgi:hypothetical protein
MERLLSALPSRRPALLARLQSRRSRRRRSRRRRRRLPPRRRFRLRSPLRALRVRTLPRRRTPRWSLRRLFLHTTDTTETT